MQLPRLIIAALALASIGIWAACDSAPSETVPTPAAPTAPAAPKGLTNVPTFPAPESWVKPLPHRFEDDANSPTSNPAGRQPVQPATTATITTLGPKGRPEAITVTFNHSVVGFEGKQSLSAASPIVLTPTVAATLTWLSPRRLRLTPNDPLPLATKFTIGLHPDLRDTEGRPVVITSRRDIVTERPAVLEAPYGGPRYPGQRKPGDTVVVRFNHRVTKAALRNALSIRTGTTASDLKKGGGSNEDFVLDSVKTPGKSGSTWAITPLHDFTMGRWFHFKIAASLRSEAGPLGMRRARQFYLRGPQRLKVSWVECDGEGCLGNDRWTVHFNNKLKSTHADCLSVTPPLKLSKAIVNGTQLSVMAGPRSEGQVYTLKIDQRCSDVFDSHLPAPFLHTIEVQGPAPRLRMVSGDGWFPPPTASESAKVSVETMATGALDIQLVQVTRSNLQAFLRENVETYGGLAFPPATDSDTSSAYTVALSDSKPDQVTVDLAKVTDATGLGVVMMEVTTERENWGRRESLSSLIQITDIGLTVKDGASDLTVWASSIATGKPLEGVKVQLFGSKARPVWEGVTNADGFVSAPARTSFKGGAWALVGSRSETDLSFIRLDAYDLRIDPWRFNLPVAWDAPADGLTGFVFTERGVYRDGETVHIKGYLRVDTDSALQVPDGDQREIQITVTDPMQETVASEVKTLGEFGDFDLSVALPKDGHSAIGRYDISVKAVAGGLNGEVRRSFRVEAYRANRFEVKLEDLVIDAQRTTVSAQVHGRYLYGAPMPDAPVQWSASTTETAFSAPGFDDFVFDNTRDHDNWWSPRTPVANPLTQGDAELDAQGAAALDIALGNVANASTPVRVTIEASVSDVDEQVVVGRGALTVHPTDAYLGLDIDGWFFTAGDSITVDLAGLDSKGNAAAGLKGRANLVLRQWRSAQKKAAGGGTTWENEQFDTIESGADFVIGSDGRAKVLLSPKSAGSYRVEVESSDRSGRPLKASDILWVSGSTNAGWARSDDERIGVVADKAAYKVGDTAQLMVQSPFGDDEVQAMVTVERRGVLWKKTLAVRGSSPIIEVPIIEEFQPNAFVSVVLVRGRLGDQRLSPGRDGGRPTMRIGYAPLKVDLSTRQIHVAISTDQATYRPGDSVTAQLKLTDHQGQPVAGQITFMAVDEGVLSLTGYQTPNPLTALYRAQGLGVATVASRKRLWELLSATDTGIKSSWGGGGEDDDDGGDTNFRAAFATTAHFDPAVVAGPDGLAEVRFTLPDNLGAFRLMAVAAAPGSRFGKTQQRITVNKPLVVRPGLPRFVDIGDTFEARAVVQALSKQGGGELEIVMSATGGVTLTDALSQRFTLKAGERRALTFKAKATALGQAAFKILVRRPGESAALDAVTITIPVQYPSALQAVVDTGRITAETPTDPGSSTGLLARDIVIPDWVSNAVGGLTVALTASRLGELVPGLKYLVRYPYGCVEQTTGTTLPLLALHNLLGGFSLPGVASEEIMPMAQAGLDRLLTMQTYEGGLSYWPSGHSPHPWGSVYGGWALTTGAKMPGLTVDPKALEQLRGYLGDLLNDKVEVEDYWKDELPAIRPFAAWVLAQNGAADVAYHNRAFAQRNTLPTFAKALLALAIDAHSSVGDATAAPQQVGTLLDELIPALHIDTRSAAVKSETKRYYWSMDSDTRTTALILMAFLKVRPNDPLNAKLVQGLLDARNEGRWGSTQQNAFAILALAQYFRATERQEASFVATVRLDDEVLMTQSFAGGSLKPVSLTIPMAKLAASSDSGQRLTVTRAGDAAPLYWTTRMNYAAKHPERHARSHGFEVRRRYVFADGPWADQPVTDGDLWAGALVRVELSITTPSERRYVAIDDPLPAGFEPVNTGFETSGRLRDQAPPNDLWSADDRHSNNAFNHSEQRDDRVLLFADRMPAGTHTHSYLARATTEGTFAAPATRAHEMYNPSVYGQSTASTINISTQADEP